MTSFLCEKEIGFDAKQGYEAKNIESLIAQIRDSLSDVRGGKVIVILRNAHYLTTTAFAILHDYVRQQISDNIIFVLVSSDKSRIFPPLLEYMKIAS